VAASGFAVVGDVMDVPQVLFCDVIAAAERLVAQVHLECVRGPVVAESGAVHLAHLGVELFANEERSFRGRMDFYRQVVEVARQFAGSR